MEISTDKIYIGMGSNLGDRLENLALAACAIAELPDTRICAQSSIYETQPRFYTAQPNFLNACLQLQTRLRPLALLQELQGIEHNLGRTRSIPNGPRTIDLDILLYGEEVVREDNLQVPHPGLHSRTFVLVPLAEIMRETAPDLRHPHLLRTIPELLTQRLADAPESGWVRKFETQRRLSKKLAPTSHLTPK